jgi:hypothetical protein
MESNTHTISLQGSWDVLLAAQTLARPFFPNSSTLQRKGTHTSLTMQFESEEMANAYTDSVVEYSKIIYHLSRALQPDTGHQEWLLKEALKMEITT